MTHLPNSIVILVVLALPTLASAQREGSANRPANISTASSPGSASTATAAAAAPTTSGLPIAFAKEVPESLDDLRTIQTHVKDLIARVLPATVGLRIGKSQGSGVIVSPEGHILTAGHVTRKANIDIEVVLHDGRVLKARTLGIHNSTDSGMAQITGSTDFHYVEIGKASEVAKGHWCLALGHPLGYRKGRPPVARLGRVLQLHQGYVRTDCALVGGDSGGPLFDMHGRVIGVHSRIGNLLSANIHVPADIFSENWDKLAKGDVWGASLFRKSANAYLGLRIDNSGRVTLVAPDSPAAKAGVRVDDTVVAFAEKSIAGSRELEEMLRDLHAGDQVVIQVRRFGELLTFRITLGESRNS